jgi:hypothetical protein
VNEKPTNSLIIQCIGAQYSPTCFVTLKYHQGVKHEPAEIGAQCRGNQRRMEAVYCNKWRDGRDNLNITPPVTISTTTVNFITHTIPVKQLTSV